MTSMNSNRISAALALVSSSAEGLTLVHFLAESKLFSSLTDRRNPTYLMKSAYVELGSGGG